MTELNYFDFNSTFSPNLIQETLGQIPKENRELALTQFEQWHSEHSRNFHHDQISQLRDTVLRSFCRLNQIPNPEYVFEDIDLLEAYRYFASEQGLGECENRYNLNHRFERANSEISFVRGLDLLDEWASMLSDSPKPKLDYLSLLIPVWFNSQIQNNPDEQKRLRAMSYQDYLKSYHWQKVRALTVFTFEAVCLGKPCEWNRGESMWFAYAPHRHVHHLSYKNRGNERFGDLCVLCNECHEKLHKQKADIVDSVSIDEWLKTQWYI